MNASSRRGTGVFPREMMQENASSNRDVQRVGIAGHGNRQSLLTVRKPFLRETGVLVAEEQPESA